MIEAGHFSEDTRFFLFLLHKHQVKYVIVGGEAVIYYGYPRLTGDVDFFFQNTPENVHALFEALLEFWEGNIPGISEEDALSVEGQVVQFGVPPNRIDLLNEIEGVNFEEAWNGRTVDELQIRNEQDRHSINVYFIGLKHLIKNKKKIGRPRDLQDLKYLEQL